MSLIEKYAAIKSIGLKKKNDVFYIKILRKNATINLFAYFLNCKKRIT